MDQKKKVKEYFFNREESKSDGAQEESKSDGAQYAVILMNFLQFKFINLFIQE